MTLYGWDASDFDWPRGPMDLAASRADGISFFTHKATESNNTQHVHYSEAMNRARAAGVPFLGAYHVVRTLDMNAQVDYFLAYVNAQTPWWKTFGGWFFQADLEKWPYDAVAPSYGVTFAAEVERRTGKRCLLYAPEWAYGNSISGNAPLWESWYGGNPAGPYRSLYPGDGNTNAWQPYSGRVPAILQFGSQATIGSQHGCDINAFRGTVADFAALIHGEAALGGGIELTEADMTPEQDAQFKEMYAILHNFVADTGRQTLDTYFNAGGTGQTRISQAVGDEFAALKAALPIPPTVAQIAAALTKAVPAGSAVDVQALATDLAAQLSPDLSHQLVAALAAKLGA